MEQDHELYVPGMEEEQRRVYAISCVLGDKFQKKVIESIEHTDMSEILRMTQTYIQNNVTDSVQLFTKLEGEQEPANPESGRKTWHTVCWKKQRKCLYGQPCVL